MEGLSSCDQAQNDDEVVANLQDFHEHEGHQACGERVAAVVEEKSQGRGIAGASSLFAVHLI